MSSKFSHEHESIHAWRVYNFNSGDWVQVGTLREAHEHAYSLWIEDEFAGDRTPIIEEVYTCIEYVKLDYAKVDKFINNQLIAENMSSAELAIKEGLQ